jgi:hypothetical protein
VITRSSRVVTVLGWLLTPFVVWAASFCGAWLGALVAQRLPGPWGGLLWLALGAILGGAAALIVWVHRLRRRGGPPPPDDEPPTEREGA